MRAHVFLDGADELPMAGLGITRGGAIHVRADGYDLYPLDTGDATWAYFRHLCALHYADEDSETWVGPAVQPARAEAAS